MMDFQIRLATLGRPPVPLLLLQCTFPFVTSNKVYLKLNFSSFTIWFPIPSFSHFCFWQQFSQDHWHTFGPSLDYSNFLSIEFKMSHISNFIMSISKLQVLLFEIFLRGRNRKKVSFCWFASQVPAVARTGPCWRQKLKSKPGFPCDRDSGAWAFTLPYGIFASCIQELEPGNDLRLFDQCQINACLASPDHELSLKPLTSCAFMSLPIVHLEDHQIYQPFQNIHCWQLFSKVKKDTKQCPYSLYFLYLGLLSPGHLLNHVFHSNWCQHSFHPLLRHSSLFFAFKISLLVD